MAYNRAGLLDSVIGRLVANDIADPQTPRHYRLLDTLSTTLIRCSGQWWPYTCSTTFSVVPSAIATLLNGTPSITAHVAKVCRRMCGVTSGPTTVR
ncbi:hypothetical protein NBEOAGPD_3149 [Methylobacterium gregans]|uniref:Uncharacterized protein n=1 Tax=Methylobacterium gregans TaxID=374424 RepID=A0AA37HS36_9HYPH|nr:hypothetical protein NBEOAGPD_3149 [Methylobacterium gregans]